MAENSTPAGNVFDKLPDVLIHNILMQCSPIDGVRVAATCKTLSAAYNTELMSHSLTFDGSTDGNIPLCTYHFRKLKLNLREGGPVTNIYPELQSFIDRTERDGDMHLSYVQELGIRCIGVAHWEARMCLQPVLRSLPNLTTIWIGAINGSQMLADFALPTVCKLSVTLSTDTLELYRLPYILPSLHTLCLTVQETMDGPRLQPLNLGRFAGFHQLKYLLINLLTEQNCLPGLGQVTSLRHLKLTSKHVLDMTSISGLTQLESLCLYDVSIDNPSALAQLKVTSLTLQSVRPAQALNIDTEHHPAGPHWSRLTTLTIVGEVSKELLLAMLLPQTAVASTRVRDSYVTFDKFDVEYRQSMNA